MVVQTGEAIGVRVPVRRADPPTAALVRPPPNARQTLVPRFDLLVPPAIAIGAAVRASLALVKEAVGVITADGMVARRVLDSQTR